MFDYEYTRLWEQSLGPQDDPSERHRQRLRSAFERFRENVIPLGQNIAATLPDFTVHDIKHLDALWRLATLIAGEAITLTPTEAFVLGGAFLIHDLGMGLAAYPDGMALLKEGAKWKDVVASLLRKKLNRAPKPEELAKPDPETEKQALANILRELHAENAERLALVSWQYDEHDDQHYLIEDISLRNTYGELIGRIAASHGLSISTLTEAFGAKLGAPAGYPDTWEVDPLKLACLLRTADAAHLDALRAPGYLRALRKPAGFSDLHWRFQKRLLQPKLEYERLVFTSSTAFPSEREEVEAWWLCLDTLQMVDHELRGVDALLADLSKPRFAARAVAGLENAERLATLIKTKDWLPVDTQVRVSSVADLISRLGGKQLYGDNPSIALREMIQNASDAIRARRILESREDDWGVMTLRRGKEADGKEWIEVEDNGVGMSVALLKGPFLDFGATYWGSALMREELPGLWASDFEATGRYGIGFFSVFMLGDQVQVTTRRYSASLEDTTVLEFSKGLSSRPILRKAGRSEQLRDGGTRVRIILNKSLDEQGSFLWPTGKGTYPMTLADYCRWFYVALDVDLRVQDSIKGNQPTTISSALTNSPGEEFLLRIWGFDGSGSEFVEMSALGRAGYLSENLRLLKDSSGRIVGRACISGDLTGDDPVDLDRPGVLCIGGFRTEEIEDISGVFVCEPARAARDRARPLVDEEGLKQWASEQAMLIPNIYGRSMYMGPTMVGVDCAQVVHGCGGTTHTLPVALGSNGWMTVEDILTWCGSYKEVLLVQRGQYDLTSMINTPSKLRNNVIEVLNEMPHNRFLEIIRNGHMPRPVTPTDTYNPYTLMGLVVSSVARGWGVSLETLETASEFGVQINKDTLVTDQVDKNAPSQYKVNRLRKPT